MALYHNLHSKSSRIWKGWGGEEQEVSWYCTTANNSTERHADGKERSQSKRKDVCWMRKGVHVERKARRDCLSVTPFRPDLALSTRGVGGGGGGAPFHLRGGRGPSLKYPAGR
jgi:hypothetical protein